MKKIKQIKQINPKDAVWCWVGTTPKELSNKTEKRLIICKTQNSFIAVGEFYNEAYFNSDSFTCHTWYFAEPCEKEQTFKWQDKYSNLHSLDAKIFSALKEGAVLKCKIDDSWSIITNAWSIHNPKQNYKICLNYTGDETDIWEELV